MIVFFNKTTGNIEGTIDGRVHTDDQLKMWIGDPAETDRLVINWEPVRYFNKAGELLDFEAPMDERYTADYEPQHLQKELWVLFDSHPRLLKDYEVFTGISGDYLLREKENI